MIPILVKVNDSMQQDYTYYRSESIGSNFAEGFEPQLTPVEMLSLGVFGGVYMRDCMEEFPKNWFEHAVFSSGKKDPSLNFFGVDASKSLHYWREKGWIHQDDPRGWFQWYCRYYMGRRGDDDVRQISRWRAMRRHRAQLISHCPQGDFGCRPRQRQALLHWSYDSRRM